MQTYYIELLTFGELTDDIYEVLNGQKHVTGVNFENNPNKIHNSIYVTIELTEEQDDDVLYVEEIIDNIENAFYNIDDVINEYSEYYNESLEW